MKELKDALKTVKTRKAPGPDRITGEMLKHLGACSRAVLLKIFNYRWMKGVVPAVWKEVVIIPVPKKGKGKKNPRIYRPISRLGCVGKLQERMVKWASHQPPGEQQCLIYNTNRLQEVQKHRGPTCLPCPEHRRCIPGEKEGSGSFLRSFKCI